MSNQILSERNLTPQELETHERILKGLKTNKKTFIKKYGKDAEKIMYGIATKRAKSETEEKGKTKLKEIIKKLLQEGQKVPESELKTKIQDIIRKVYNKSNEKIDLDNSPNAISLDNNRFPALQRFPKLKEVILKILTNQYELFLKSIEWVAPRPTTFRIVLANDQNFYLIYTDRSWIGKVEGKKYYLLNLNEEQNFIESIARILSYGAKALPKEEIPKETPKEEPLTAPENDKPVEEKPEETPEQE